MRDTSRKARGWNDCTEILRLTLPFIRFALMDAEITDLTSSGAAEMVVGPVVFENFVLDHPGR